MTQQVRDPLRGMPTELRVEFDRQSRLLREAYLDWWRTRRNTEAAHRDCWPAFLGGWRAAHASRRAA